MFKKDRLYQQQDEENVSVDKVIDFAFDEKVASVFPDMIHRSVPGYTALLSVMQAVFKAQFSHHHNLLFYDLGCSVGAVTLALAKVLPKETQLIGVDISAEMLKRYEKAISLAGLTERTKSQKSSITDIKLQPCQGIAINFTLQFLPPTERQGVIDKCYAALDKGGILFIAEKIQSNRSVMNWHEQFKRNNGYSELEIVKKRLAIEKVMRIDDEKVIIQRAQQAGFKMINPVFMALGFKAWVMHK